MYGVVCLLGCRNAGWVADKLTLWVLQAHEVKKEGDERTRDQRTRTGDNKDSEMSQDCKRTVEW